MKPLSVRLCLCPSANKKAYSSFIIDSRKIIYISGEKAYNPLQDVEAIFSKKCSKKLRPNFRKNLYLHKMPTPPSL